MILHLLLEIESIILGNSYLGKIIRCLIVIFIVSIINSCVVIVHSNKSLEPSYLISSAQATDMKQDNDQACQIYSLPDMPELPGLEAVENLINPSKDDLIEFLIGHVEKLEQVSDKREYILEKSIEDYKRDCLKYYP